MTVRRFPRQAVLAAAAFSLALTMLAAPVRAADDGEDDEAFDSKIMRNVLESIGLVKDGQQNTINYQERAPLVIPPSSNLPVPEKADAAIANNPSWPKDPDLVRKKEAAKKARVDRYKSADQQLRDDARPLSPSQMTPGASASNPLPRVGNDPNAVAGSSTDAANNPRMTPTQLGYRGGLFGNMFGGKDDEIARFTGEPPRASLTDPPTGYQTPSPDQPYGVTQRVEAPKPTDYLESKGQEPR